MVKSHIFEAGYHVDIDETDRTIQKKVRDAQLAHYNYILVVGEEEVNTGKVSVRVRDKQQHSVKTIPDLLQHFKDEVKSHIFEAGYHVDIDETDRTIQKKVRDAQLAQYNYISVVGEEEVNTGKVSVRVRDKQQHSVKTIPDLLQHFKDEVEAFH
ncbi:hypothetical protein Lser_V15G18950 [Lactuca serriola]